MPTRPCPHCRHDTLVETKQTKIDTDDRKVTVWKCASCKYSEGVPTGED